MIAKFLRKKRTTVKPVSLEADSKWIVTQGNTVTEFMDDLRRYGMATALWNIRWQWRDELQNRQERYE